MITRSFRNRTGGLALSLILSLLVFVSAIGHAGCASGPQWRLYGGDVLGCAAPGISATVEAGVSDLANLAAGQPTADWRSVGTGLAAKYGTSLAICAVEAAFKRFAGGSANLPAAAPPAAQAAAWLVQHKAEWTK